MVSIGKMALETAVSKMPRPHLHGAERAVVEHRVRVLSAHTLQFERAGLFYHETRCN